jgi:PPOX class probable F420-dependent enzyme
MGGSVTSDVDVSFNALCRCLVMDEAVSVPDSTAEILASELNALAHIATIGLDGGRQSSPVWSDWENDQLRVSLYDSLQKMKNLRLDPRLPVSTVDPANAHRYVEISSVAMVFEPDTELVFITRVTGKYLGLDHCPWHEEGQVEVTVTVKSTRITGMSN